MDADSRWWGKLDGATSSLPDGLSWSPDGKSLAFEDVLVNEGGVEGIVLLEVSPERRNTQVTLGACLHSAAWAPVGRMLAYYVDGVCLGYGDSRIVVADLEPAQETLLVSGLRPRKAQDGRLFNTRITWSPDARYVAYDTCDENDNRQIWKIDRQSGERRYLTAGQQPDWASQRDEIAFVRDDDIWVVSVATDKEYLLVDDPVKAQWPAWSPDAEQLLFVSWRDDLPERRKFFPNTEIYSVDRRGANLRNLTNHPAMDTHPAWRPKPLTSQ